MQMTGLCLCLEGNWGCSMTRLFSTGASGEGAHMHPPCNLSPSFCMKKPPPPNCPSPALKGILPLAEPLTLHPEDAQGPEGQSSSSFGSPSPTRFLQAAPSLSHNPPSSLLLLLPTPSLASLKLIILLAIPLSPLNSNFLLSPGANQQSENSEMAGGSSCVLIREALMRQ